MNMPELSAPSSPQSSSGGASLTAPKKWDELTAEEKVETLRYELLNNRHLVRRLVAAEAEIHRLKQHYHTINGDVVVSIHGAAGVGSSLSAGTYDRLA